MKAKTDELQQAVYELSSKVYQQAAPQGDPNAAGAQGFDPNAGGSDNGGNNDGFVDADYTEVK